MYCYIFGSQINILTMLWRIKRKMCSKLYARTLLQTYFDVCLLIFSIGPLELQNTNAPVTGFGILDGLRLTALKMILRLWKNALNLNLGTYYEPLIGWVVGIPRQILVIIGSVNYAAQKQIGFFIRYPLLP